jgi:hypothetical protein
MMSYVALIRRICAELSLSKLGVRKGGLPPLLALGLLNPAGVNHPS